MGKTVILAAMPVEFQLIWNQMENKEKNIFSGFRFWRGMLNGKEVVLGECGVGKVNAAMATLIAIEHFAPSRILHNGIAGGLKEGISHTDLVVATDLAYYDVRKVQMESLFPFCSCFPTDKQLSEVLLQMAQKQEGAVWQGRILTGDDFIADPVKKHQIQHEWDALCVDMESAAIAHAAYINNVPFAAVRCISDLASDATGEEYEKFEQLAAEKSARLMLDAIGCLEE